MMPLLLHQLQGMRRAWDGFAVFVSALPCLSACACINLTFLRAVCKAAACRGGKCPSWAVASPAMCLLPYFPYHVSPAMCMLLPTPAKQAEAAAPAHPGHHISHWAGPVPHGPVPHAHAQPFRADPVGRPLAHRLPAACCRNSSCRQSLRAPFVHRLLLAGLRGCVQARMQDLVIASAEPLTGLSHGLCHVIMHVLPGAECACRACSGVWPG